MPAKLRKPGKRKRRHLGLTGSKLIHMVNSLRKQGFNEKQIRKRCGYQDPIYFQRMLDAAHAKQQSRQLALQRMREKGEHGRSPVTHEKARQLAQQRLARGESLTTEDVNALPEFQRIALLKSMMPMGKASRNRSRQPTSAKPATLENCQLSFKPPELKGESLLSKVLCLSRQNLAEINIAIKCGYNSERIGIFRRELAKAIGCKIAPLSRLLIYHRQLHEQ